MSELKLHEIAAYYQQALDAFAETATENPDATSDELYELLDSLNVNFEQKLEDIGSLLVNKQSTMNALKEEEKRLADRRKKLEKEQENLLNYVEYVMNVNGFKEIKGLLHTFKITTSSSLVADSPEDLPLQFQKVEVKANIKDLKEHIKRHYDDLGVKLVAQPAKRKPKDRIEMTYEEVNDELKREFGAYFKSTSKIKFN